MSRELFPVEAAVGNAVQVGNHVYQVVGCLREQADGFAGLRGEDLNRGIYLPLPTCQARFGERVVVRETGARRVEAVQVSAAVVRVASAERGRGVAGDIRRLLMESHEQKDWEVLAPGGR